MQASVPQKWNVHTEDIRRVRLRSSTSLGANGTSNTYRVGRRGCKSSINGHVSVVLYIWWDLCVCFDPLVVRSRFTSCSSHTTFQCTFVATAGATPGRGGVVDAVVGWVSDIGRPQWSRGGLNCGQDFATTLGSTAGETPLLTGLYVSIGRESHSMRDIQHHTSPGGWCMLHLDWIGRERADNIMKHQTYLRSVSLIAHNSIGICQQTIRLKQKHNRQPIGTRKCTSNS